MNIVFVAQPMKLFLMPSNFLVFSINSRGESEGFNSMHGMIIQVPSWYTMHALYHPTDATDHIERGEVPTKWNEILRPLFAHRIPPHTATSTSRCQASCQRRVMHPGTSILIGVKRSRNKK